MSSVGFFLASMLEPVQIANLLFPHGAFVPALDASPVALAASAILSIPSEWEKSCVSQSVSTGKGKESVEASWLDMRGAFKADVRRPSSKPQLGPVAELVWNRIQIAAD